MAEPVGKVILCGVRLSFDHLFEPVVEEKDDGSKIELFKCNFLIPKDRAERERQKVFGKFSGKKMDILDALRAAGDQAMEKKFGDKAKWPKIGSDKTYMKDGDDKDYDGYEGCYYLSAKTDKKNPPSVLSNRRDGDGEWVEAEPGGDNAPYAGCYVNAICSVWIMDHPKFGKRKCLSLHSVQFYRNGESFRAIKANPNEDFTDDMVGEEGGFGDDDVVDDDVI